MKKIILLLIFTYLSVGTSYSQEKRDFFTMVKGDSLAIFLINPPSSNEEYNVFRQEVGVDKEFILLTKKTPVKPVIDASEAKVILGFDYELIKKALNNASDFEILRTIRSGGFKGGLLSLISNKAAKVAGRWYLDENIKSGKTYEYKLVFENSSGVKTDSITKKIIAKEIIPNAPKSLVLEAGKKKIKVKWEYPAWNGDFSDLGFRYNVYRKVGAGSFEKINDEIIIRDDTSVPDFNDLWLQYGEKYSYYVKIVDPVGNESKASNIAELLLNDETPPSIVKGLTTEPYTNGIALTWDMSLELDAAGYYAFRSLGLDKKFKQITNELVAVDVPFFIDTTVSASTRYFYAVAAVDTAGNIGKQSNPISAYQEDKVPPSAPTNLSYTILNNMIELKWNKSESKDVKGYYVYRGEKEKVMPRITHTPITTVAYSDSGYKGVGFGYGGKFIYKVSAVDFARNESEKVTLIVYAPDLVAPKPPTNFTVKNFNGRYIKLYCGGSPSLDDDIYTIYRSETGNKEGKLVEFTETPFNYKDTSVIKGRTYIYYATVIDTAGNISEPTKKDTIFFKDFSPPPKPGYASAKIVNGKVELKWSRVIDFDFVGFNVYRSDFPTGTFIKVNKEIVKENSFTDPLGTEKHFYRIRSVDTSGNESKYDETVSAK